MSLACLWLNIAFWMSVIFVLVIYVASSLVTTRVTDSDILWQRPCNEPCFWQASALSRVVADFCYFVSNTGQCICLQSFKSLWGSAFSSGRMSAVHTDRYLHLKICVAQCVDRLRARTGTQHWCVVKSFMSLLCYSQSSSDMLLVFLEPLPASGLPRLQICRSMCTCLLIVLVDRVLLSGCDFKQYNLPVVNRS
jgi:hypothetical protein